LPIGTLREVLSYPETPEHYPDDSYVEALERCRLPHLVQYLDRSDNWSMALSPGEQQRLAFARALLFKPDWLFMDEATSALDEPTEAHLYELLDEALPGLTLVSIAHKPSVLRFHDRRIVLDPESGTVRSESLASGVA
jgi:putative ATP-binding cassette transporter